MLSACIFRKFEPLLDEATTAYPERAKMVFEDESACRKRRARYAGIGVLTVGGACTGGYLLNAAWAARAAAAASTASATAATASANAAWFASTAATAIGEASTATAAAAAATATATAFEVGAGVTAVVVGGGSVATASRFPTANEVDKNVKFEATGTDVESGKCYEDTLIRDGKALFIGEFSRKMPHGTGKLFWPGGQQAFAGKFKNGKPVEGLFIDEVGVIIGYMSVDGNTFLVKGFQPEDVNDPTARCSVCIDGLPLLSEGKVFLPCRHGDICVKCHDQLPGPVKKCPSCRSPIEGLMRV